MFPITTTTTFIPLTFKEKCEAVLEKGELHKLKSFLCQKLELSLPTIERRLRYNNFSNLELNAIAPYFGCNSGSELTSYNTPLVRNKLSFLLDASG